MTSRNHKRSSDIFLKACELQPEQREAYLDEVCAGDSNLREEIESLLHHDAEDLLKTGEGAARAASLLASGSDSSDPRQDGAAVSRDRCSDCGKPIPSGFGDCPACRTQLDSADEETLEIPGHTILRLLGKGGMGKVFLAEDNTLGRRVAIKIVSEEFAADRTAAQRFVREARTMATVEHPHIVRVYSFGEVAGRHFLVMEYVEGESLARRIRRLGKLPLDESLRMLSEALDALSAAWTHGIVHRDIKPANILLDAKDRVRVADFGLAKGTEVEGDSSITHAGQVFGTPHYVSPEQARSATDLDFRTDVYSLGIVLYEMLTGEPPFQGATPISVIDQHLHTPVPPLHAHRSDVPGQLEQLCMWMVQKQPTDRPASYEELIRSVELVRGRSTVDVAVPGSLPSFLASRTRRSGSPLRSSWDASRSWSVWTGRCRVRWPARARSFWLPAKRAAARRPCSTSSRDKPRRRIRS